MSENTSVVRPEVAPGPAPSQEQIRATRERLMRERAAEVARQARA